ncbi:hypothetical protein SLEP1_g49974 [Rubroshorea leprosula]|uniref:non-specific serine/threonine protein kinase n=1 Tax=Rubroshorea leprosula TaxID=152421 RepID=A0AAV5LYI4_9ROSI|nr:hypothetical protein SLEP1_g49974 [Rubroshorea leprosula]
MPRDFCDTYGCCGAYSYCDKTQLPPCQCLEGFEPKSTSKWSSMDWSQGCVRKKPLNYQQEDGFIQYQKLKLPDAAHSWISRKMVVVVLFGLVIYLILDSFKSVGRIYTSECLLQNQKEEMELPVFELAMISYATNHFSLTNKLGQGGFGPVYKGKLMDGQEIAMKRLSRSSGQGFNEFKNEVKLIAKLQHRNRVRLLGCCIEGEEKLLVYEYMPNRSLDSFIFDQRRRKELNWPKRFQIICGIARGLLYLHQDFRLWIIHGDLKASNVLLDKYAVDGFFSVKSDVFSFGVLLMEIVSGTKNRGMYHSDHSINLIGHIPEDRPTMSSVLLMLGSEIELPQPKEPGFLLENTSLETDASLSKHNSTSNHFLPLVADKLGGDGLIGELCNGFNLLDLTDDDLRSMLKEGDLDGDGVLIQMEFCVLMFRLSPELMEASRFVFQEAFEQELKDDY